MSLCLRIMLALGSFLSGLPDSPRTAEDLLAEMKAVGEPEFDPARKEEPGYLERYRAEQHRLYQRKAALLLELCTLFPADPRLLEWVGRRWTLLAWNQNPRDVADELLSDVQAVAPRIESALAQVPAGSLPDIRARIAADRAYWTAFAHLHRPFGDVRPRIEAVETFVAAHPQDERGAGLLAAAADDPNLPADSRMALYRRLSADFSDSHGGKFAPGMIRRLERIGQPFEISFQDLLTGRPVSMDALRGKVVLVDFWATTCGPCVSEMPELKVLHAHYHAQGVEFIGVSLDESEADGGKAALRAFLQKNAIPWPQFYQGAGYDSPFSASWGVGSAPTIFLIDKQGRLRQTDPGDDLEKHLTALIRE